MCRLVWALAATDVLSGEDTAYAPCACSPVGKMYQQSQPYAPPNSAAPGTTYTYDALGRTVKVLLADGASYTTYAYQGNFTTVVDPAGKWKQYANDALGNLVTVLEPDPTANPVPGPPATPPAYPVTAAPTGMLLTSYTYDQVNHLTQVAMPRNTSNGMKTQTRTFVYTPTTYSTLTLPALWLTSATNPENGTVSYTYNADGTLASKTDANGNTETYTYDAYQRLTAIPDRQQTFTYDTCPTTNATGCVSAPGQLVQATFGNAVGPEKLTFAYNYAYTPAGKVTSKTLAILTTDGVHICCPAFSWIPDSASVTASYTYDNQGALTSMGYTLPTYPGGAQVFTYTLDAMERPTGMTDNLNSIYASGATYNAANQLLFDGSATSTYNNLLQVTSMAGLGMNMTYNYPSSQNNGQIASSVDAVTGETITYQYDALKRLQSVTGKNWGETYAYDGYGNLTQMSPTGTAGAPSLGVTVALDSNNVPTNRIAATGVSYDNNGNQTAGLGGVGLAYDVANRVSAVTGGQGPWYAYDSDNRRIYREDASGTETIYFYGVDGRKLAAYTIGFTETTGYLGDTDYTMQLNYQGGNVYFAGRMIRAEGNPVTTDRLGSVRNGGPGALGYQAQYPYGVEYTLTVNDREKYATYTRDSSGLDYAMNRYYSSQWGRFLSPDPYGGSAATGNPQSWNRYAYAGNDSVNNSDPSGLYLYGGGGWGPGQGWNPDPTPWPPGGDGGFGGGGGGSGPTPCIQLAHRVGVDSFFRPCGSGGGSAGGGSGGGSFTTTMRNNAANAIKNMAQGCQQALGQKWNLYDGNTSLLYKVNAANPNADVFFNAATPGVANLPMTNWGFTSSMSTGTFLSDDNLPAFVGENDNGTPNNQIILGPVYYAQTTAMENVILLHEVLHTYTGLNDIPLGVALGLPSSLLTDIDAASAAISTYLNLGCNMAALKQSYGIH